MRHPFFFWMMISPSFFFPLLITSKLWVSRLFALQVMMFSPFLFARRCEVTCECHVSFPSDKVHLLVCGVCERFSWKLRAHHRLPPEWSRSAWRNVEDSSSIVPQRCRALWPWNTGRRQSLIIRKPGPPWSWPQKHGASRTLFVPPPRVSEDSPTKSLLGLLPRGHNGDLSLCWGVTQIQDNVRLWLKKSHRSVE